MVLAVTTSNQYHTGLLTPDCPGPGPASCEPDRGKVRVPHVGKQYRRLSCLWWYGGGRGEGGETETSGFHGSFLSPANQ